ncbi:hypothetical protein HID58_029033, partial [Brassica napus]
MRQGNGEIVEERVVSPCSTTDLPSVKRIHVLVKIVVPCTVFEVEFPIPPDRSVHLGSYNG